MTDIDVGKVAAEAAERARIEERLACIKVVHDLRALLNAAHFAALTVAIERIEARSHDAR